MNVRKRHAQDTAFMKRVETSEYVLALGLMAFGLFISFGVSKFTFEFWYSSLQALAQPTTWGLVFTAVGTYYFLSLLAWMFQWFSVGTAFALRISANVLALLSWLFVSFFLMARKGGDLLLYQVCVLIIGVLMGAACVKSLFAYLQMIRRSKER